MHKTGSTSIQSSLQRYDDGVSFYARLGPVNHSVPVFGAFCSDPEKYHFWRKQGLKSSEIQSRRERYRERLARNLERRNRKRLIISAEDASVLDSHGKDELMAFLRQFADTVTVVCYVRDPVEFAASSFQQNIRSGVRKVPNVIRPRYRDRLERFREMVTRAQLIVRKFDSEAFEGGSVVRDFCALAHLDPALINEERVNDRLPAPVLKLLYRFNRSNPCFSGERIVHHARQQLVVILQKAYDGYERTGSARFAGLVDDSEADYLRTAFDIEFGDRESLESSGGTSVDDWLVDLSDVDLSPLARCLAERGILTEGKTPEWMVNRLFYHCVSRKTFEFSPREAILALDWRRWLAGAWRGLRTRVEQGARRMRRQLPW